MYGGGLSVDQYLDMCEQMGWEPDESRMPIDPSTLPTEAQNALILLQVLPDLWDGMGGNWLGKDYSGLLSIMEIYDMQNRKEVFEYLKLCEAELDKYYAQKRKEQESMNKAKSKHRG